MQLQTKYFEVPTEQQREKARKAVNSTAGSVKKDVQHLIEWLEKQPHLPNFRDEHTLTHTLLQSKNSSEKVKYRLEMYFKAKASYPEMFCDRNPFEKSFEDQHNLSMFVPLRKLTPDGFRVVILYLSDVHKTMTSDFPSMNDFIKINLMAFELVWKLDYSRGFIILHDSANITMPVVTHCSSQLQKTQYLLQEAMPASFIKTYCFNMGTASGILLTIFKKFMRKKLAKRIEILKNPTDLCKVFPKQIIPREYGGDELPVEQLKDLWFEDIKNNYEYLKSMEKFASDISKMPKDSTMTELSGMAGSFRQISID